MKRLTVHLENEKATQQAGADIAMALRPGMLVFLKGDLGAGKTCLARAIIRNLAGDNDLEVPSPTFSIVQTYQVSLASGIETIIHADLYRIEKSDEVDELGFSEQDKSRLILVEWPENADGTLGAPDLVLSLTEPDSGRVLNIECEAKLHKAIKRSFLIRYFLDACWVANVERQKFFGDASPRSYESVSNFGQSRLLMNAPRQDDGPLLRNGKSYSQLAHLAEDVSAFVGVQTILEKADLSVPQIYASNLKEGLLLLENLGSETIVDENRVPIADRYMVCVEMLAETHQRQISHSALLPDGSIYQVPDLTIEAMMIEVELLLDWYTPHISAKPLGKGEQDAFLNLWQELIAKLSGIEKVLVVRDFHSPNIIWLPERQGINRVGLIDFQDAVIGPAAYDLASVTQDARVDIPAEFETQLVDHYINIRQAAGNFDRDIFLTDYAIIAAQRATKILGIFVRLDERDGKPAYLKHLPRIEDYISRSLKHPALIDYRRWYENIINTS